MASALQTIIRLGIVLLLTAGSESSASAVPPPLTAEQMRQDLVFLRDVWAPQDKSFAPADRARFMAAVEDMISAADRFTPAEFSLEIARAVALAHNGHTNAELGPYFRPLPFRAVWFADGLFIVRVHPSFKELLGARIDSFGRLSSRAALRRVTPFISGSDEHVRILSANYLRLLEVLEHIGATRTPDKVTLRVTLASGKTKSVALAAEPSADPEPMPSQHQLIRRRSGSDVDNRWLHVLDGADSVPDAYRQLADVASEWLPGDDRIFYIRSNIIDTTTGSELPFQVQLAHAFEEVAAKKPRVVVMDLRYNHGGLLLYTVVVANGLPRMLAPGGKMYVLVGPGTFSAAIAMAAMIKGSGRDKVVLVGDTMGDYSRFWAEGLPVQLPNSRIPVQPAMGYHDWENGCDGNPDCFWGNAVFAKQGVSLQPEIKVLMNFKEYAAGRDVGLEAALAASRKEVRSQPNIAIPSP